MTADKPDLLAKPGRRGSVATKKLPSNPSHPHRLCRGCDKYCPAHSVICGNGADRTQHPVELFGPDWERWGQDAAATAPPATAGTASNT